MNFKFLFICALLFASAFADEATPDADVTAQNVTEPAKPVVLEPSPDVTTYFVFPTSEKKAFTLGKPIDLVVGFINNGKAAFNVTGLQASLLHPQDFSVYVQNYTQRQLLVTVQPTQQVSLLYSFLPDAFLEPRDFGLLARVFYTLDNGAANYSNIFYNGSVILEEPEEPLDAQTLFTYVGLLGVAGLVVFLVYRALTGGSKRRSRRPATKVEMGTQRVSYDSEWLEGTSADPNRSKSPIKTRSKTAKKD